MTRDRIDLWSRDASCQVRPYYQGVALPTAKTRRLIILGLLSVAAVLFGIAVILTRANPSSLDLPVAIQAVSPEAGSNVLSQTTIEVDLAVGYTAELEVNGLTIPENELFRIEALNQLSFRPGVNQSVTNLLPDQNCIRVFYWLIAEGPLDQEQFTWCFDAS